MESFGADFARVWLTRPGDRCQTGCPHAEVTEGPHVCVHRDRCLHLAASSGRYTHLDGQGHSRVPFGCYKIGRVASGEEPSFLTNDVTNDPRVHDHGWARDLDLVSFAGYQLRPPHGETIGVMALFSQHVITPEEDALLKNLSNLVVPVIQAAEAEQAVRQSRELLRLVLDTIPQAVFWKDRESRYLGCNRTFARQAGLEDPARIPGLDDFDLPWRPEESDAYRADDRAVIESGEPRLHIIETQQGADAVHRWIDTSKVPLTDTEGRSIGVLGVYDDITERKQMEQALEARNEELVRFSYTVSHDLKSPLVTIQTFLGFLEKDLEKGDGERVKTDFEFIRKAAAKMLALLEELLELSRIGRKMNPPEDMLVEDLVGSALEAVAGAIAGRGARVDVSVAGLRVRGDRARLAEVFQNLIDNAIKFRGDQAAPHVEIGVEEIDREWVLFVRDTGLASIRATRGSCSGCSRSSIRARRARGWDWPW